MNCLAKYSPWAIHCFENTTKIPTERVVLIKALGGGVMMERKRGVVRPLNDIPMGTRKYSYSTTCSISTTKSVNCCIFLFCSKSDSRKSVSDYFCSNLLYYCYQSSICGWCMVKYLQGLTNSKYNKYNL